MKAIKITVTGSNARVTEKPVITSGTVGLPVEFTFDEVWEGLSKTAVFRAGSRSYPVNCEQNAVAVPWEVLEKPGIGLYIGVFGTDTTGAVRIPTVWALVDTVHQGTTVPEVTPTEATPNAYDQILAAANAAEEIAQSVREDADKGLFNGEKGIQGIQGDKGDKGDPGDRGQDGVSPHIGANGNWWIGDTDTGVAASGGMTEEQAALLEALGSTVFETVLVPASPNLLNPSTAELATVLGMDCWRSDIIPCSVGDIIYSNTMYTIGTGNGISFGVILVGEDGTLSYPTASAYRSYTIQNHPTIQKLVGFRIFVKVADVPYEDRSCVMLTLNENPAEFQAWAPAKESTESRVQKNAEQIADLTNKTASRWDGKNVLVFGDSISTDYYANYTKWATVLKENAGFELFNYSVHGYGFVCGQGTATQGEYNMINQIERAYNDGVNPNLVILFMGTNDFANKVPIGQPGDGTSLAMYSSDVYLTPTATASGITTFYGGVEHCMARIKQLWSAAMVCVLTPLQRINQTSATEGMALVDYRDIIVETAKRFTFPVKDLYNEANFSPCNPYDREAKTYQFPSDSPYAGSYDGLHPNEAYCRDVLAPMIGRFIENI